MIEVHYFEAYDGTKFDEQYDCEEYEWTLDHYQVMNRIHFYDKDRNELEWSFDEEFYGSTEFVEIGSEEEIEILHSFAEWNGWCCFEKINYPGEWRWDNEVGEYKLFND